MSESNKDFRSLFELCANLAPLQWHRMIWNTVGRGPSIKDVGNLEGGGVTNLPFLEIASCFSGLGQKGRSYFDCSACK